MSRLIPYPLVSFLLLLMWLLLTRFSLGHVVLGGGLAVLAGWAMAALQPVPLRLRRWTMIVRLFFVVGWDIIRSNIAVAGLILTNGRHGKRTSGFVLIELELRNPNGLAVLACIVTATPGTAWLDYDSERNMLILHVFDLLDEEEWRQIIRDRYESMLMEIFE